MAGTALGNGFAQAASSSSQHPHLLSGSIDMDPFSAMIFHDDDQEVHAPVLVAAEESALFLVEALYPYAGSEGNHLNFDKGDIIEVWGREESGWWDGFLKQTKVEANREKRGWFPSNYVKPLSAEASEAVRRLLDIQTQLAAQSSPRSGYGQVIANGHPSDEPEPDMQHDIMSSAPSLDALLGRRPGELSPSDFDQVLRWTGGSSAAGQMLDLDEDLTSFSAGGDIFGEIAAAAAETGDRQDSYGGAHEALPVGLLPPHTIDSTERSSNTIVNGARSYTDADWVPKVSTDDRVFAYNTRTGDSAMDFPSFTSSGLPASNGMGDRFRADSGTGVSDKSKWMSGDSAASRLTQYTQTSSARGFSTSTMPTSTSMPSLSMGRLDKFSESTARPSSSYSDHSALDAALASFQTADLATLQPDAALTPRKNPLASELQQKLVIQQDAQVRSDDYAARKAQLIQLMELVEPTPARTLEQYQHDCEDALGLLTDAVQIHSAANMPAETSEAENGVMRRQRLEEAAEAVSTATRQLLTATELVLVERHAAGKRMSASSMGTSSGLSVTSTLSGRTSGQTLEMCPVLSISEFRPLAMKITANESKLNLSIRALWGLLETRAAEEAASDLARETEYLSAEEKAAHSKKRAALLIARRDIDAKLRYDLLVQVRSLGEAFSTFVAGVEEYARRKGHKAGRAGLLLPRRSEATFAATLSDAALPACAQRGAGLGQGFRLPLKVDTSLATPIAQHFSAMSSSAYSSDRPYRPLVQTTLQSLQVSKQGLSENLSSLQTLLKTLCGSGSNASLKPSLLPTVTKQVGQLLGRLAAFARETEEVDLASRLDIELDETVYAALTGESLERVSQRDLFASKSPVIGAEAYAGSLHRACGLLTDLSAAKELLYTTAPTLLTIIQSLSVDASAISGTAELNMASAGSPFVSPIGAVGAPDVPLQQTSVSALFETLTAIETDSERVLTVLRDILALADEQASASPELRKANNALRADLASLSMPQSSTSTRPSRLSRGSSAPTSGLGLEDEMAEELDSTRGFGSNGLDGSIAGGSTLYSARGVNDSRGTIGSSTQMQRTASVQSSLYRQALGRPSRSNSLAESFVSDDSYRGRRDGLDQELGISTTSPTNHSPSKSKLKQFFGADAPGQNIHRPPTTIKEMPSFLQADYTHDQISYANDGSIRAGTLHALVCRLTNHMSADRQYNDAFLMTYKTFCTSQELLSRLKDRYNLEPPVGISQQDQTLWYEQKQKLVRIRVVNALRSWITDHLYDDDEALLDQVSAFAVILPTESSQQLARIIERRKMTGAPRRMTASLSGGTPPPPILPRNLKKIKFLDVDPLEIARQLTIIDSRLFSKITVEECLNKAWPKKFNNRDMPNFTAIAAMSNAVTGWVAMSIVGQPDLRRRVAVIKHFIAVADKCRSLSNFTTLMQIVAGLNSGAIYRLKRTWELVNQRSMSTLTYLGNLMSPENNHALYRDALKLVGSPCVPFLGVYFTDWVMSGEANSDYLRDKPDQINFAKRARVAASIQSIQLNQATPYNLSAVPALTKWIMDELNTAKAVSIAMANQSNGSNASPVSSFNSAEVKSPPPVVDIMAKAYDLSLKIEPRERDDERIARLLSESGFI